MADTYLQLKAIDALLHLHTSIKKLNIYPPLDPIIINSIETLYLHLLNTLKQDSPQDFEKLGKNTPLRLDLLQQQDTDNIHISSILNIILGSGIKSISFDKNSEREELHISINLPDKTKKNIPNEEGLLILALEKQTASVHTDIKADKQQEVVSGQDLSEAQISEHIAEMNNVLNWLREREGTIESYFSEEQRDLIKRLSGRVAEWLKTETSFSPAYKEIFHSLQNLIEDFIQHKLFAEANGIIDIFNKINTGDLKRDDDVRKLSLKIIQTLASEKNINILFNEININEKNKTTEACQIFFRFGDIIMKKLLDSIRDASDSKERVRIIHIIQEMGERAIPAIKESITPNSPWYYLRNMAYIIGRIGNDASVDILRPLLFHKDKRVRVEAFKSVCQIGENKRGQLLVSVLNQVDQDLKLEIIETLGKIKYAEAVTDLLYIFKSKTTMAKEAQTFQQEKICNALGAIGSPEAVPALSEIVESKSFLGIQSYPKEVIYAAKRALTAIKKANHLD